MPSVTTWSRLEPRARSGDMRPGLEAAVHDPLWLLGRQWQLGEFQGEDAGSPVSARLRAEVAPLKTVRRPGAPAEAYDAAVPLEAVVEGEPAPPADSRSAAETGLHFLRLLADEGVERYAKGYLTAFPLTAPAAGDDKASRRYLTVMAGRAPDGLALAAALRGGLPAVPKVTKAHRPKVEAAATRFLRWLDELVDVAPAEGAAWQRERFEYRFEVSANSEGADLVLVAPEYGGGTLDWDAFVHDAGAELDAAADPTVLVVSTLPVRASYAGMPAPRFWEIEDSRVDFGGVEAAPSDLARMLVLDFATVYGNDWYVVPLELPVGTLTHVRSLVVGDTFGGQWLIGPASEPGWTMFEPTSWAPDGAGGGLDRLFLPPALGSSLEGEPLEEVMLLRDEGANVAWAIERAVEGIAGNRVDRIEEWHEERRWRGEGPAHAGAPEQIAPLVYRLSSEVPEYWIPLVPEDRAPGSTVLRVSALERPENGGPPVPILPHGRLLEPGTEMLIPEEEVPAEGAHLTRSWQYARWIDGSVHLWSARRKRAGRGMGASGLAFDTVEPWRAPPVALAHEEVELRVTTGALGGDPVDLDALTGGQAAVVHWRVRNTGTATWRRTTPEALQLRTDAGTVGRLRAPSWLGPSYPGGPAESVVGPGQVATFLFEIRAPKEQGAFDEEYQLLVEGRGASSGPRLRVRGHVRG